MALTLYNTLTRKQEEFRPEDPKNVRMYVCGPTVYDRPHLGNARSVVIYDVLYRLLQHLYGEKHVTYVRNITDVDDKINASAKERGISIQALTSEITSLFQEDMAALNVLRPTREPKATEHIAEMIAMIEQLIANGNAYVADGHVLFAVKTDKHYGQLSGRVQEDLKAGARIEVESYKRDAGDFVLWKPAGEKDDVSSVFDSPWGKGRPGWHIECSAMSVKYLSKNFDLHGGGADLMFPHHENEIAQSTCANPGSHFAKHWVHNGFLTVNGEKMSKSLGNFITVRDLLEKGVNGEVIRFALLSTHYRKPLDWTDKLLEDAKKQLDYLYRTMEETPQGEVKIDMATHTLAHILEHDLNIPEALAELHRAPKYLLRQFGSLLGILQQDRETWFKAPAIVASANIVEQDDQMGGASQVQHTEISIKNLIDARLAAKKAKDFAKADQIRKELAEQGIILEDKRHPDGTETTDWRRA